MRREALKRNISRGMKVAMFDARMTYGDLARASGASKGTIGNMVCGNFLPQTQVLTAIADALDCSVDWLLGRTTQRKLHG